VFVLVSCTAFGATRLRNNGRLHALRQAVTNYPRPPQTEVLNQELHFGALVGLHDHCDLVVRQTLLTRLSLSDIETFYQEATIPSVQNPIDFVPLVVILDQRTAPDGRLLYTLIAMDRQAKGLELRCN
jgi:hypothetical protein